MTAPVTQRPPSPASQAIASATSRPSPDRRERLLAEGDPGLEPGPLRLLGQPAQLGRDDPGPDDVDPDAVAAEVEREGPAHRLDGALAGDVAEAPARRPGDDGRAEVDDRAPRLARSSASAARVQTKTLTTLARSIPSKSSSARMSMGPWTSLPALLTRTSMPPNASTAAATIARASASTVTSARTRDDPARGARELRRQPLQAVAAAGDGEDVRRPARPGGGRWRRPARSTRR